MPEMDTTMTDIHCVQNFQGALAQVAEEVQVDVVEVVVEEGDHLRDAQNTEFLFQVHNMTCLVFTGKVETNYMYNIFVKQLYEIELLVVQWAIQCTQILPELISPQSC